MQTYSSGYKNSISCFWKIFRTEGLRGLYAGWYNTCYRSQCDGNSALFLFYGQCRIVVVFKKEGVFGLVSALLLREVPANFFYFGGYEGMKNLLRNPGEEDSQLATWKLIISGGVDGMTYWASIYPIDVLKTKLQVL